MAGYPQNPVPAKHVEPVPRRIRARLGNQTFLDTTEALYVWEFPSYPQYHLPPAAFPEGALVETGQTHESKLGTARLLDLHVGDQTKPKAGRILNTEDAPPQAQGYVRLDWGAVDEWFEEDERVFVHPRSPFTRVDAIRSSRTVRVELDGVVLAESSSPVLVFETGLPTRHYLPAIDVDHTHLVPSNTTTACPYKGRTTGYWSVRTADGELHPDLAWSYDFPTAALLPITGLIAFYDEKIDTFLDGVLQDRPRTHFA